MIKKSVLDKIKKTLTDEREALLARNYSSEVDIDGDETDEIQGNIIATVNLQLSSRDSQKLVQIEGALKRIEEKRFGICEECEDFIAEKRLEHNPHFSTCISCAEQAEMESKQRKRF